MVRIIALGKGLGLTTTAEGIETDGQLADLKADGCPESRATCSARRSRGRTSPRLLRNPSARRRLPMPACYQPPPPPPPPPPPEPPPRRRKTPTSRTRPAPRWPSALDMPPTPRGDRAAEIAARPGAAAAGPGRLVMAHRVGIVGCARRSAAAKASAHGFSTSSATA